MASTFFSNSKQTCANINNLAFHLVTNREVISEHVQSDGGKKIKYMCPFCGESFESLHQYKCKKMTRKTAKEQN
jgi:hypothetical protein